MLPNLLKNLLSKVVGYIKVGNLKQFGGETYELVKTDYRKNFQEDLVKELPKMPRHFLLIVGVTTWINYLVDRSKKRSDAVKAIEADSRQQWLNNRDYFNQIKLQQAEQSTWIYAQESYSDSQKDFEKLNKLRLFIEKNQLLAQQLTQIKTQLFFVFRYNPLPFGLVKSKITPLFDELNKQKTELDSIVSITQAWKFHKNKQYGQALNEINVAIEKLIELKKVAGVVTQDGVNNRQLINLNEILAIAYNIKAKIYRTQGMGHTRIKEVISSYETALQVFGEAIQSADDNPIVHTNRGSLCNKLQQDYKKLEKALLDELNAESITEQAIDEAMQSKQKIDLQKSIQDKIEKVHKVAEEDHKKASELDPNNPWVLYGKGYHYYVQAEQITDQAQQQQKNQHYLEAINLYTLGLMSDSKHFSLLRYRGMAWAKLGDLSAALQDYNEALNLIPHHPAALQERGLLFKKMGETDKARADLKEAKVRFWKYPLKVKEIEKGLDELTKEYPENQKVSQCSIS